ncbi:MAG: iron-sulfur cluster assembly accessory protein [Sphingobacteriales bacterium]|nr:iron-sulfur cluster assembly accessory protein [Sphingobacteriales bacterium]MCC7223157.1 iron-sulfur cluster assembly accessory protein [Chitinophagales bacterium]
MPDSKELTTTLLDVAPITFTPSALQEIKMLVYEKEIGSGRGLRVGVSGGGCSGLSYILGFDDIQPDDDIFMVDEVRILLNKKHALYLLGMQVDYVRGLNNRGFVFSNPNASSTCGCGSSFAV